LEGQAAATTEALIAPYLQLRDRITFGPWEIIPRRSFEDEDAVTPFAAARVRGLLDLYNPPGGRRGRWGCIVREQRRKVGEPFARKFIPLRRAIVTGLLDANRHREAGPDNLNVGHGMWTSDNATLWGHRISPEGYIGIAQGVMVRMEDIGWRVGEPAHEIRPPTEVTFPIMAVDPDPDYLDAVYQCVTRRTPDATRRGRAIDWLDLAWRNTPSVTMEMRIVLLRSGFEVLLGVGDKVDPGRRALAALLRSQRGRVRTRSWTTLRGRARSEAMSDLEWWFMQFVFLRNAIVHGDEIPARHLRFGRQWQLWIGEGRLRDAIKETVGRAGFPHPDGPLRPRDLRRSRRNGPRVAFYPLPE
jgi:hypothetical protein